MIKHVKSSNSYLTKYNLRDVIELMFVMFSETLLKSLRMLS